MDSRIREIEQWLAEAKQDLGECGREAYIRKLFLLDAEIRSVIKENGAVPETGSPRSQAKRVRRLGSPALVLGAMGVTLLTATAFFMQSGFHPRVTPLQPPPQRSLAGSVPAESGPALQLKRVGRGLAVADMDNDGDLDVVVSNQGQAPLLLRNETTGAGWIEIRARGKQSNGFGLGARIELEAGGQRRIREVNNVASYESSNDVRVHFGLGSARVVQRLSIFWPSGKVQILQNVPVNQFLVIEEPGVEP